MPTLEIDGQSVTVEDGLNLIQAADRLGIEIPHYCWHPGLTVAGNCRMCLVEIEKMPKLQIACNTRVSDGMVVHTRSERAKEARQGVLEFLLINHPVDCPICDQAGECKLQDYYMDYDREPSRVPLEAKVQKGKALDIGERIILDQERCILCTRCTRFLDEVTETSELGVFARGDHCKIDLFPERRLDNAYSMNVADICPVGALTSKPFRFRARVWYLDHTPSVCPTCATGCNIDIHHRRGEIFRFRPRANPDVNQYWMCDEGRLSFTRHQGEGRLLSPVLREEERWAMCDWVTAVERVSSRLQSIASESGGAAVAGVVSAEATVEEAWLFRTWVQGLGGRVWGRSWSPADASQDDFLIDADKNPNTGGLRALGMGPHPIDDLLEEVKSGKVRGLVLLRTDVAASHGEQRLDELAEHVEFLTVIDTHHQPTGEAADVLLPVASFAETDGVFVNRGGRAQRVRPAFPPPGRVRPGWEVLADLHRRCGGEAPQSAEETFAAAAEAHPTLHGLSYESIGARGAPLAESPAV